MEQTSDDGLGDADGVRVDVGEPVGVGVPLGVDDRLAEKHCRPPANAHWPTGHAPLTGPLARLPPKHKPVWVQ